MFVPFFVYFCTCFLFQSRLVHFFFISSLGIGYIAQCPEHLIFCQLFHNLCKISVQSTSDAEKERLTGEIEDLRRKLAMSDKDVTAAHLHFSQWQAAFNQLTQAVSRIEDEDKVGKLCAAIRAQLAAWGKAMEGTP